MSTRGSVSHTRARRTPARALLPLAGGLLLLLLAVSPALGHAELDTADPENKAKLATPPETVTLTFTEGLDAGKSSFSLDGPDGDVGTGKAAKDGAKTMTLDGLSLVPGAYTIAWTAAAEDGHIERGKLGFTVLEPSPPPASPSPSPSAAPSAAPSVAATAAPSPTPSPTPSAAVEPSPGTDTGAPAASTSDVLLPIVAGLVVVGVLGVLVLRRGRSA